MKPYILLRNNHEYGPFSVKELLAMGLQKTDLLWIEGESKCWLSPSEIPAFANSISNEGKKPAPAESKPFYAPVPAPILTITNNRRPNFVYDGDLNSSTNDGKRDGESYFTPRHHHNQQLSIGPGFFGFIILLMSVALSVFIFKGMVQSFHTDAPASTAHEIKGETLAVSSNSYTAKSDGNKNIIPVPTATVATTDTFKKKMLITKSLSATNSITGKKASTEENLVSDNISNTKDSIQEVAIKENTKPKEADDKLEPKPVAKPVALQISTNDYKVGLLGGISNLILSVTNPSSQTIESATIEVEFLKPNGNVVKSEVVTVDNIAASATKSIAVPSNSRGVKVRYHVVN